MKQINIQYYKTKIGELILGSFDNKLCLLDFRFRKMRQRVGRRIQNGLGVEFVERDNAILRKTKKQINECLSGERKKFSIPIMMIGTDFQKEVWKALLEMEYGETASYLELARKIGNGGAVRAVANANGANVIGLIIPCHRIVGSNGTLGGYAGGLAAKKRLLKLEEANK